jgi:hypothetical protein
MFLSIRKLQNIYKKILSFRENKKEKAGGNRQEAEMSNNFSLSNDKSFHK